MLSHFRILYMQSYIFPLHLLLFAHTYDMAMLEAQFAKQVYDNTVAQLDADYAQSAKTYEQAQQEYQEYLERVQNNTFYDDYDIVNLKKAYEEAKELYANRKEYWEVTDDELNSGSSENVGTAGVVYFSSASSTFCSKRLIVFIIHFLSF